MRFLIDECLTVQPVAVATDHGYEAHHITHLDMAAQKDWDIARHAQENDFVFVTNNAADFRALYATQELHPGLVILIPNVRAEPQRRLFTGALEQLAECGEPVNQVLEVDLDGEEVIYTLYDLPRRSSGHCFSSRFKTHPLYNNKLPDTGRSQSSVVGRK